MSPVSFLEKSVYRTIRYFDLFDQPVTATQIWYTLAVDDDPGGARWAGHKHYALPEVQEVLATSPWLHAQMESKWGYYFLKGKSRLVRERLQRHVAAQEKWKLTRRAARWLALVPFVCALAGSGSLAADNTKRSSDLDIFIIVKAGRIWTARLGLLIVSQLLGRRRKYWNREAPDKLCLNHYVSDEHLLLDPEIRNIYTAASYQKLIPLAGRKLVYQFQAENEPWMRHFIMTPSLPRVPHVYTVSIWPPAQTAKRFLEGFLLEPLGEGVERLAERLQRWFIARHASSRAGRIVLSPRELAFHPDTKVPALLQAFYRDPGQKQLF